MATNNKHKVQYTGQTKKTYLFLKKRSPTARAAYVHAVEQNKKPSPKQKKVLAACRVIERDYPGWFQNQYKE